MVSNLAAAELLAWRREQLQAGGEASALDWLLDLEGGLSWQTLQQLWLHPERSVELAAPLSRLEQLWQQHLCVAGQPGGDHHHRLRGRGRWRHGGLWQCHQHAHLLVTL